MVTEIYVITKTFPKEEQFSLVSQMRRAAVSIPSNIAEGAARRGNKEFKQFLYIALGSLAELETQLMIAENFNYIDSQKETSEALIYIRRMRSKLIKSL
ncbi:four helix bundle protein [Snuella lapsa]|uniref:Four helix bundle protein n=1 Tax=Snuella lapsa TaxID=870481 RepID=A0ABP6XFI5_9FLAO